MIDKKLLFRSAAAPLSLALVAPLLLLGACAPKNEFKAPPPPMVTVAPPVQKELLSYYTATGETRAYQSVDIRARVRGFLEEVAYDPAKRSKRGTGSSRSTRSRTRLRSTWPVRMSRAPKRSSALRRRIRRSSRA
jgi:hypothetical protein